MQFLIRINGNPIFQTGMNNILKEVDQAAPPQSTELQNTGGGD